MAWHCVWFELGAHFEGELVLLAAPDLQALVVAAQFEEELLADGEQTAGHHWTVEGLHRMVGVGGQPRQTLVVELPVEGAAGTFVLRPLERNQK